MLYMIIWDLKEELEYSYARSIFNKILLLYEPVNFPPSSRFKERVDMWRLICINQEYVLSISDKIKSVIKNMPSYVEHYKIPGQGRIFHFSPMLTREKYISLVLDDVKGSLFGNSAKKLFSFLIQTEELSEDELLELLQMVRLSSNAEQATEQ